MKQEKKIVKLLNKYDFKSEETSKSLEVWSLLEESSLNINSNDFDWEFDNNQRSVTLYLHKWYFFWHPNENLEFCADMYQLVDYQGEGFERYIFSSYQRLFTKNILKDYLTQELKKKLNISDVIVKENSSTYECDLWKVPDLHRVNVKVTVNSNENITLNQVLDSLDLLEKGNSLIDKKYFYSLDWNIYNDQNYMRWGISDEYYDISEQIDELNERYTWRK